MSSEFPYKSLHDYLDVVFKDKIPDEHEIIEAKKQYWKLYNTFLKRDQRKKRKEVTITLDKGHWEFLNKERISGQSIPSYCKELLLKQISNKDSIKRAVSHDTTMIEQQLFLVADYLESLLFHRRFIDGQSVMTLDKHLLHLRKLLEELFQR